MEQEKLQKAAELWKQVTARYYGSNGSSVYNSKFLNPYSQNVRLKNIRTKPRRYTRSEITQMVENPADSEQGLRAASHYFYNTVTPIMKQYNMYADILTYRYWLQPAPSEINKDSFVNSFMKQYLDATIWLKKLNPKKVFKEIVLDVLKEGKVAYLIRDTGKNIFLQRLPSDYVKIVYRTEVGWQVAFNFLYFSQEGVSPDYFPDEMKDYYNEFSNVFDVNRNIPKTDKIPGDVTFSKSGMSYFYWKELPVGMCLVFSFDDTIPDVIPPLSSQFVNANDLDSYKILQQQLLEIPLNQILTATVPLSKNTKSGSFADDTAITPDLCIMYENAIRASLPENIDFVAAPFENFSLFNFEDSVNRNNVIGDSLTNFYNESLGGLINTSDKPSMAAIKTQQKIETGFISKIYNQFMVHINYQLSRHSFDSVVFKISGDVFEDATRLADVTKAIASGNSGLYFEYLSFFDYDLFSFSNAMDIISKTKLYDKLIVPPTSFTSGADEGKTGRPAKSIDEMTSDGSIASAENELNTSEGRGLD